jgi:hypothetical protein
MAAPPPDSVVGSALKEIDDTVFAALPSMVSLNVDRNQHKGAIFDALRSQPAYQRWTEHRAGTVSRQIVSGARATLTD